MRELGGRRQATCPRCGSPALQRRVATLEVDGVRDAGQRLLGCVACQLLVLERTPVYPVTAG